jgi:hypothetical protein
VIDLAHTDVASSITLPFAPLNSSKISAKWTPVGCIWPTGPIFTYPADGGAPVCVHADCTAQFINATFASLITLPYVSYMSFVPERLPPDSDSLSSDSDEPASSDAYATQDFAGR